MRKVKATITYTVPEWNNCNVLNGLTPTKKLCRFCSKTKQGHICILHNEQLAVTGDYVAKTQSCIRATCGFKTEIEDVKPTPPAELTKYIMNDFAKVYKQLRADGYPADLAVDAAKQIVLKG